MYNFNDLLWVKNVKRDDGNDWAYNDSQIKVGSTFNLHWPKKFKGNVLKPSIDKLILLFQSVNNPRGTYLTHIVTPVDTILGTDLTSSHPFYRKVKLLAKADPIDSIKKPDIFDFYRPNRGACCELNTIKDMETKKNVDLVFLQQYIWNLFLNHFSIIDLNCEFDVPMELEDDEIFLEGTEKAKLMMHKYYERDPKAVKLAKELAIKNNKLHCEVCSFDFSTKYKYIGNGFIECHHKMHISSGQIRQTSMSDLSLVCSNCHRMLHRKYNNKYLSIDELKVLILV